MYPALRPLLFALPPELAHKLALAASRGFGMWPGSAPPTGTGTELLGLSFANRIGLAAGFDKDATAVAGLAKLGFGFLEVGTVTPRPQPGNPKPRLFRLHEDHALINRMGFNSAGATALAANLRRVRSCIHVPIGVNIGKNRETLPDAAVDDYRACLAATYDVADYVVVNISSPNTPGLRALQAANAARALVTELVAERQRLAVEHPGKTPIPPLFVKIAPDPVADDLETTVVEALEAGADGIVATNTTVSRPPSLRSRRAVEAGGLSGRPLFALALETVRRSRDAVGGGPVIVGVGGISSPGDAAAMFDVGADLVQVYSALVFEGPALVRRLVGGS